MIYLVGPFVAAVGLVAIFFVMRRKAVDKRSMYSARRSQIEHKVRAARQRTLAPHGHAEKQAEAPPAPAPAPSPTFAPKPTAPTITYQPAAYQPPPPAPAAPVQPPPPFQPAEESGPSMWDTGGTAPAPEAPSYPAQPEPYQPPPEETPKPAEEWTPGPAPDERVAPFEPPRPEPPRRVEPPSEPPRPVEPARPVTAAGAPAWSIVGEQKAGFPAQAEGRPKETAAAQSGSWQLASGEVPGTEAAEEEVAKRPSGTIVAVAQYAILVVGLVMVLIGVLVMVANSHPS
jgi:hypothetical protein